MESSISEQRILILRLLRGRMHSIILSIKLRPFALFIPVCTVHVNFVLQKEGAE